MPILVRVISLEQSVQEPLLFGAPSFHFTLRRRPTPLPPAPFDASDERIGGICLPSTVKGVTILTTRTWLLQIFEILPLAGSTLFTICLLVTLIRKTAVALIDF